MGCIKKKEVSGISISVYNKPSGILLAQELEGSKKDDISQVKSKYKNKIYFILSLNSEKKNPLYKSESMAAFSENLQILSFRMDQYANLTTSSKDTIPVMDFVYPRTYGVGSAADIMLVFNKDRIHNTNWVSLNILEFGMGTGDQQFRFKTRDLIDVPKLKI